MIVDPIAARSFIGFVSFRGKVAHSRCYYTSAPQLAIRERANSLSPGAGVLLNSVPEISGGMAGQPEGGGEPLLAAEGLVMHYAVRRHQGIRMVRETVRAVDGIDLVVRRGETVGLVGESGCGKSTAARAMLRLETPTAGRVLFDGADLAGLAPRDLRRVRSRIGVVFQDPVSALNPRMMVGDIVAEPVRTHGADRTRRAGLDRARELLTQVGLDPGFATRYPHEFSGGQRQRIGIARAIATNPEMVVLDEPISALDISVRAQILNLLMDLREECNLSYLLIAHDLTVVRHVCDRVAVMYLGRIVEEGPAAEVFGSPLHPYTRALIASAPSVDPAERTERPETPSEQPSATAIPSGCRFRTRCPLAQDRCAAEDPAERHPAPGRRVACHLI